MAASPIVTTLRTNRDQVGGLIAHLEDRLKEARTDLAHVNATLRLFEMDGEAQENARAYMNLNRVLVRRFAIARGKVDWAKCQRMFIIRSTVCARTPCCARVHIARHRVAEWESRG
jgi:hypothetical protein